MFLETFLLALCELPIMVPIAFVLEFFIVGKAAKMLAFTVMKPTDRPQLITYVISILHLLHYVSGYEPYCGIFI